MYSSGALPVAHSIASDAIKREPVTRIASVFPLDSIASFKADATESVSVHGWENCSKKPRISLEENAFGCLLWVVMILLGFMRLSSLAMLFASLSIPHPNIKVMSRPLTYWMTVSLNRFAESTL